MKNMLASLIISTCIGSFAAARDLAPCDLKVEKDKTSTVFSGSTNNYSGTNYVNAMAELDVACKNGTLSKIVWNVRQVFMGTEYGFYSASCTVEVAIDPGEFRKKTCAKIAICITEADVDKDVTWLINKQDQLMCTKPSN